MSGSHGDVAHCRVAKFNHSASIETSGPQLCPEKKEKDYGKQKIHLQLRKSYKHGGGGWGGCTNICDDRESSLLST